MHFSIADTPEKRPFSGNRLLQLYLAAFLALFISTAIGTTDVKNWILENTLTIIFLTALISTYRKFRFSDLSYTFIFVYLALHVYGAKYTYSENPLGYWLKDAYELQRNPYDRIVHFSFGFMLSYPMRELLIHRFGLPRGLSWIIPLEVVLSFSALYELIEWAVADVFFPEQGIAYLGTQGDVWDAQKDMFLAWGGSFLILFIVFLVRRTRHGAKWL